MPWDEAVVAERAWTRRPVTRAEEPVRAVADTAGAAGRLTVGAAAEAGRVRVRLWGEFDYDCRDTVDRTLTHALDTCDRGIDLDMEEVTFWECSSLNVLLDVRRRALRDGKTVTVRTASPVVHRVLRLTGTLPLFAPGSGCDGPG
ncbi:STAS domain-containing protein [Streptomyces sp. NPDC003374]